MATLPSPAINWGGAEPQAQSVIISPQGFNQALVLNQGLLVSPAANQLAPPAPTPDQGLFVWQRSVVDGTGNVITDARVDVRRAEDNVPADIFDDRLGVAQKSNPFFVDDEGFARFYAASGLYTIRVFDANFERIFENVLLGIRLEDIPNLSSIVTPIVEAMLDPVVDEVEVAIAAVPDLIRFYVEGDGDAVGAPGTYTITRTSLGNYKVQHNNGSTNYTPKLTVWDPSSDRVYSAMMVDKQPDFFTYRVRSIQDEASSSDSRVDIEITFP